MADRSARERTGQPQCGRIVLVGGGVRSGKSHYALRRALRFGARRVFVATAEARDGEMEQRIRRHREERGADFRTIEEPVDLPGVLARIADADVVLVDCLTLWLSNLLMRGMDAAMVAIQVEGLLRSLRQCPYHVVLVTNEVGMGVVPESPLGRLFRDLAGTAHQRIADAADEIYLAALGTVLRLRPDPVTAMGEGGM